MKCSLCQTIADRLNELDDLHGEEFIKQFEKTLPHSSEPEKTEVSMKELLSHKKAQYEAGWLDAIEEIKKISVCFKITEQSLDYFRSEDVFTGTYYFTHDMQTNNILQQLQSLLNKEVTGEDNFIDMLKKAIGDKHTAMFKTLILKHSRILEGNVNVITR